MRRFITFPGAETLPVAAVELGRGLEADGHRLSRKGDQLQVKRNGSALSGEDSTDVRRWRLHLLALVDIRGACPQRCSPCNWWCGVEEGPVSLAAGGLEPQQACAEGTDTDPAST